MQTDEKSSPLPERRAVQSRRCPAGKMASRRCRIPGSGHHCTLSLAFRPSFLAAAAAALPVCLVTSKGCLTQAARSLCLQQSAGALFAYASR